MCQTNAYVCADIIYFFHQSESSADRPLAACVKIWMEFSSGIRVDLKLFSLYHYEYHITFVQDEELFSADECEKLIKVFNLSGNDLQQVIETCEFIIHQVITGFELRLCYLQPLIMSFIEINASYLMSFV